MKIKTLFTFAALMTAIQCFGWGQKGHDVIAYIAENHLEDGVKDKVEAVLDGKSMVYYANWMDNASHTPEYAYSKTWHYKNIDEGQTFETAPTQEKGDVVTALNDIVSKLMGGGLSHEEEKTSLKFLIHLVGDMHQPLHLGHLSDYGGNTVMVKFFGQAKRLHTIWDTNLVESAHKWSYTEWQKQIDRASEEVMASYREGTIAEWAKETYEVAKLVYASAPEGTKLSYDYVAQVAPVIEDQFLRAGIRLAHLLNTIYGE